VKIIENFAALFFPHRCVACGKVMENDGFCSGCAGRVARVSALLPRGKYTDGLAAPFFYTGPVRQGLLNMKYYRRRDNTRYFGGEIAAAVRALGLSCDGVCFVPMGAKSQKTRGFNQSERLAARVGEILGLPVLPAGLVKCRESRPQHRLSSAARRENISGCFAVWDDVRGRRILLIDDIKTTGATLEECARILKTAGAAEVVGAVAAVNQKTFL
jgi:competence protein ComFC